MKAWHFWVTLIALAGFGLSAQAAVQVTDDQGVVVRFEQTPERIVSLLPSLTETVCALGNCQRLVGVDRYSTFPSELQKLPKLGGGLDPNIEAIVALRPDVVLLATSSRAAADRLRQLGLKVLALEPKSHADVQRVMSQIGQLLAVADVNKIWQTMDAAVSVEVQSLPAHVRGTRVYFEVNSGPYAASESSFIGETLTRLGVKNIVPASLGPFPKLNPEFIVRAQPDLIMVGDSSAVGMVQRPGWVSMRALRAQRVCEFSVAESDILVRPGPRMVEGARLMARCLVEKIGKTTPTPTPTPAART